MSNNNLDILKLIKILSQQPTYDINAEKKWKRTFIKYAPYTSLGLCGLMASCGLFTQNLPLNNSEWHLAIMAALVVLLLLFVARKVKKKKRSPMIPLTMAHIVPLWGLLIISVFFAVKISFVQPRTINTRDTSSIMESRIAEETQRLKDTANKVKEQSKPK